MSQSFTFRTGIQVDQTVKIPQKPYHRFIMNWRYNPDESNFDVRDGTLRTYGLPLRLFKDVSK